MTNSWINVQYIYIFSTYCPTLPDIIPSENNKSVVNFLIGHLGYDDNCCLLVYILMCACMTAFSLSISILYSMLEANIDYCWIRHPLHVPMQKRSFLCYSGLHVSLTFSTDSEPCSIMAYLKYVWKGMSQTWTWHLLFTTNTNSVCIWQEWSVLT